ncbi:MAG: YicC family protein [Bacteroidales bacterium]|nr:YicC family protein [Bacteroidales bacterium]
MIKSMTGYGKASANYNNKTLTIEIKTLNSKQIDLNLKLNASYRNKEIEIRNKIANILERGKVDCYVIKEFVDEAPNLNINTALFVSYYKQFEALADLVNAPKEHLLHYIFQIPEINSCANKEIKQDEVDILFLLMDEALEQTDQYRLVEGKCLERDLLLRISLIGEKLLEINKFETLRIQQIKDKLLSKLNELDCQSLDMNRFEQEIIYYLEKLDITEEKTRLKQHLDYFVNTMNLPTSQGKKLGFIAQEIGREINTLGSKAQDANMQKIVVQMKDELEKIKEQILNVL